MNYYESCVKLLTSKEKFHIELGLSRVAKILEFLGNPQDKIKIIHVAGTNGKGSTCAILNSILTESGYKVGLFTSPHLVRYNERIKINSLPIPDKVFFDLLVEINQISKEKNIYLTEFEILTVVGYLYFYRENVDYAIIEVGLGGRLDATNVVKNPLISVITSISIDHVDRLGDTVEKIAFEKAGIIKENSICCVLDVNKGLDVIKKCSLEKHSSLKIYPISVKSTLINGKSFVDIENELFEFGLIGKYQEENLSLVLGVVNELKNLGVGISEDALKSGLKNVCHNGRFEMIKEYNLIIDGAHNLDGAKALRSTLDELFPQDEIVFIYSTINTKDYKSVLNCILTEKDEIKLLEFSHPSAVNPKDIIKILKRDNVEVIKLSQIKDIIINNNKKSKLTVITGSLYAIGEVYDEINLIKNSPLG